MIRYSLILLIILLTSCTNFLFVPVKSYPVSPDQINVLHQDIFIKSSDGHVLHGWKLSTGQKKSGTILFFHGNGDNVSTQLPNTFWLTQEGYDIYTFDYSGYGKSEGYATLEGTINDLELMIKYVVNQLVDDEKLIILGHSLGGSMAIYSVAHSAYKHKIKTIVTLAAFSDYHEITQDVLSRSWLLWLFQWPLSFTVDNSYRPLNSIALLSPIPVLIMHSKTDKLVSFYHAIQLFEVANDPKKLIWLKSDHNNIFIDTVNRQKLLDYLSALP